MRNKNKNQYGTFAVQNRKILLRKKSVIILGSLAMTMLTVGVGLAFFNSDNRAEKSIIEIPKAEAVEIPGWWFKDYFGTSICDKDICKNDSDPDDDKLNNAQEFYYHSSPLNPDTNDNGLSDGEDVAYNYDPSKPGKVTFEEAASDEQVLGEGLLFNEDAVKIFSEVVDLSKARLPEVNVLEFKVNNNNSRESIIAYLDTVDSIVAQYFPQTISDTIEEALKTQNLTQLDDIKERSVRVVIALKATEIPSDAVPLHKYYVSMFQILPTIVTIPSGNEIKDQTSAVANFWFDQMQAYSYAAQQSEIEINRLNAKYK